MKDFRDLEVWTQAHQLTLRVYKVTGSFPREELFGLTSQMRRCSASVAANIAEGCGTKGNAEFHRFLLVSSGSASELEYHLLLAHDLGYIRPPEHERLTIQLSRMRKMLAALIRKVENDRLAAKC